ncbi:hypothetical protein D6T64_04135 [Cryobacterium melibiosiphilum]|uniref:Uncharacterized protein n=1 Tax=Cryobacterium melibiosiphilum TaxID=995039 RepID=A0A3A5MMS4_9MICO|nr:hypothetical protein [Cryobacterium melibiosiphilum]RJT90341.1 hypothetical protein D6T64_04135 [Cryobacterium melibiosiphilum]
MTNYELTPCDTGARFEPKTWVDAEGVSGEETRRPATADDYGRVDFDEFDTTAATVWMEPDGLGGYVLHITAHTEGISIAVDGEYITPHAN